MTDSSDEQIITRKRLKRTQKTETLEALFDSSSEYEPSSDHFDHEGAAAELAGIFGTRTEYLYLLEEDATPIVEQNSDSSIDEEYFDEGELQQYVLLHRVDTRQQKIDAVQKAVACLNEGYSAEHIVLNIVEGEIGIEEMYELVDLCAKFQSYRKVRQELEADGNLGYEKQRLDTLKELLKYKHLLPRIEKKYKLNKRLLNLSGFFLKEENWVENITQRKQIHVPIDPETNVEAFLNSLGCTKEALISYYGEILGRHPLLIEQVLMINLKQNSSFNNNYDVLENFNNESLVNLFLIKETTNFNELRKEILTHAFALMKIKEKLEDKKREEMLNEAKHKYYKHVIDIIVNGAISYPVDGTFVFGATDQGHRISLAVVDFKGELVESGVFCIEEVEELYEKYKPQCIGVAGIKCSIRNTFNILRERFENVIYVENELINLISNVNNSEKDGNSFTKGIVDNNYPLAIARRLIYPEVEIAILIEKEKPLPDTTSLLSKEVKLLWMKRGLLTALSIVGIDLNYAVRVNRAQAVIKLLPGIRDYKDFLSIITEYGFVSRLEVLETNRILRPSDFASVSVYLRIFPDIFGFEARYDPLDSTPIHPQNYSLIRMICAGYQGCDELDDENPSLHVEQVLNDPERLMALKVATIEGVSVGTCEYVVSLLKKHHLRRPIFKGAPDWLLFKELIGDEDKFLNKKFEGRVVKAGDGYGIVSIDVNGVSVFVRDRVFSNQLVSVYIDEPGLLCFRGRVIETTKKRFFKFVEHNLFRDVDSKGAEEYLRLNNKRILIRRSGKGEYGIITLMISDDIYLHLCLIETITDDQISYQINGHSYEDINEILSTLVRGIFYNLKEIRAHKRFYSLKEKAEEYLNEWKGGVLYCFYLSKEYPGRLVFAYNAGRGLRREYIGIKEELEYDKRTFKNLDEFINYRKGRK
ncbi:Transcription elongation factor spt6 [Astathelohania contejeani]|uniref:Transcription elongation factor spt6 n=1 Tax=Astathelohania contejeani TaxID=164912 RepID=A0ABQ7HZV4_9MICR|nr:Transcription elongation factor spt6 [Thelohania contejeani]